MEEKVSFKKWAQAYRDHINISRHKMWPNETLTRIAKASYIPNLDRRYKGKKILDVGCGSANNLWLFGTLGMKLFGCEVHEDIVKAAKKILKKHDFNSDIRVGENTNLPFKSNFFDYIVSWNVLHYENSEKNIEKAIDEYARVLKKGGRIFFCTTGPKHMILKNATLYGDHLYKVRSVDKCREGEIYFYFDNSFYLKKYFGKRFKNILVGSVNDYLFTEYQDYLILTAISK